MMPPVSAVPRDLAVKVLKKHIAHFAHGLPPWNSEVWKLIEKDPELMGRWKIGSIRTNIRLNRRNILSDAKMQCGIFNAENINNARSEHEEDDIREREYFSVEISRDLWDEIRNLDPLTYKGRKYLGFKPHVWTNKLALAFWKQYHLKCAFVFKRGKISKSGKNYATISGYCKAKNCKNPVTGVIKDCPGDVGPVNIKMFCRDTRFTKHDDVKRPLNGTERLEVQNELSKINSSSWRKYKAKDILDSDDTGSPFLYDYHTLHQAKNEACDQHFGIKSDDNRDMILAIRNMNRNPNYVNSILAIGDMPFYVFYATPTQFQAYSEYQRTHRQYSSICIDATGSVVKRLIDSTGNKTAHIFLYEVVINFNGTTIPVFQMLSEIHDVNFISFWLSRWINKVKLPKEAVCDGSKALLNAMSIAFNNKTLKEYINFCFEMLITGTKQHPKTYIRLDTAHFIHSVSRWKCFQLALNKVVKTFFIHCVALIVECRELKQLEEIFVLMLIVANTDFEDSIISVNDSCNLTPLDARSQLENLISNKKIVVNELSAIDLEDKTLLDKLSNFNNDKFGWSEALSTWVNNLCQKAGNIIITGTKLNCFYVRGLHDTLTKKIKEFPIFTNILCTPKTMSRATSCYVEGDFKDLKMNMKKQVKLPTTVLKFLKLHISELIGGVSIFRAKVNKFIIDNQFRDELNEHEYQNWFENWKGKNKTTSKNEWTKYDNEDDYMNDRDNRERALEEKYSVILYEHNYSMRSDSINNTLSSTLKNEIGYQDTYRNEANDRRKEVNYTFSSAESTDDCMLTTALEKMYKTKSENKKESKYFQNFPEVKLQNNLVNKKIKKVFLLENGNVSGSVSFNQQKWLVYNTCPFDTIIQILFYGALENPLFHELVKQSEIPVFKFLKEFMNEGPTKNVYVKRLSVLYPLYKETNNRKSRELFDKHSEKTALCQTIDCRDNISNLWKKLLQNAPSVIEQTVCSNKNCHSSTIFLPVLTVNHNVIIHNGFPQLENALNFPGNIFNISCKYCQLGTLTRYSNPKEYIYIELDIRGTGHESSGRTCTLCDLPLKISLQTKNNDETGIDLDYRLSGVAAFEGGHYFAYCRRLSGCWKKFNDLKSQPESVCPKTKLEPHGIFYVLEQQS